MQGMFVGGRYLETAGSEIEVRDPARRRVVDVVRDGEAAAVGIAVDAARDAATGWRRTPGARRGEVLLAAARGVAERITELAPLLTAEQGKPLHESKLELARFVRTLEHFAGLGGSLRGRSVADLDDGATGHVLTRPLGVVGVLVRWNFPITLLGKKLGPALVTGNTVVAKPDESTPLVTLRVAEIMHAAGLPDGVLNVVTGYGETTGAALAAHPDVAMIAFTGSDRHGQEVLAAAGHRLARATAELDSSDPLIVCADADVERAVSAASWGRFFNCGQGVLAVKRVYAHASVYDRVVSRLAEKAAALTVGPGDEEGVQLGPMHSSAGRERIRSQLQAAVTAGARVVVGGEQLRGPRFDDGWFFPPTVVVDAPHDSPVAVEDTFGPLLPVWPFDDVEEAIARANASRYGVAASLWTRDHGTVVEAMDRIESGYLWVNSPTRVYDELPFGSVKRAHGKDHGLESLAFYQDVRSVVLHA